MEHQHLYPLQCLHRGQHRLQFLAPSSPDVIGGEAMIDKDKVLPLVAIFVPTPNLTIHEFHVARGLAQTVEAQRDADWERGMLWLTALKELLTVAAHSNNCG